MVRAFADGQYPRVAFFFCYSLSIYTYTYIYTRCLVLPRTYVYSSEKKITPLVLLELCRCAAGLIRVSTLFAKSWWWWWHFLALGSLRRRLFVLSVVSTGRHTISQREEKFTGTLAPSHFRFFLNIFGGKTTPSPLRVCVFCPLLLVVIVCSLSNFEYLAPKIFARACSI